MSAPPAFETLRSKLGEIHDIVKAGSLLSWDQQVLMPPLGAEARANQLATLGKLAHEFFISDEVGNLLEELRPYEESLDRESNEASLIRVARHDYEKAVRVPPEFSAEITRVGARSFGVWVEARSKSDYESFRPNLEQLVELKHRYVDCFPPADELYDTLLDDYEQGMKAAEVRAIFDRMKEVLVPLVEAAAPAATAKVTGHFPAAIQRQLSLEIVRRFGFDDSGWRLDTAPHPFAQSLATQDIRITTREPEDSLDGLFASMHECGHGLYENGVDPSLERTLLARGASLGLHQSQSRLWENLVGRSEPFWSWFYPRAQETFPSELGSVDEERWFRSINDVRPGLIRIEADEASYNLHIILRFELEQRIMDGLDLRELPELWNEAMDGYLGVDVPTDALGVLQDVHWSRGGFGYFPTYSLGNVISVQIWEKLRDDVDDVEGQIARGEFAAIREWLREHLHRHGRKFTPAETLERAVGGPIDPEPYLAYLQGEARGRMIERVCVAGAGVIGSLFAGHLASVAEVSVLCRREEHARALNAEGLRVSGKAELSSRVVAGVSADELPEPELVIVATKANGLEAAAASLAGHWPDAVVMPVLNGLGAEEVVRGFGSWRVLSAVTFISGTKHSDTHVEYILDTETWLGPYDETPLGLAQQAGELIARSGLKVEVLPDLRPAQWSKLIFNATVNGVAALTGLPHDFHFAEEDASFALGRLVHRLVDEGKAVARAAGIELHDDPWEMNVLATRRGAAHFPSMLEDVERLALQRWN